jgi:hypothetical protein
MVPPAAPSSTAQVTPWSAVKLTVPPASTVACVGATVTSGAPPSGLTNAFGSAPPQAASTATPSNATARIASNLVIEKVTPS